jgi:hypothetical protein
VDNCDSSITYTWDFGDGTPPVTGKCVTHAYNQTGGYGLVVTWTDCDGGHRRVFEVEVRNCSDCDMKPGYTYNIHCPFVDFDATPTASNQPVAMYVWDFGDGSFGTGQIVNNHFYAPGNYTVTLSVYSIDPDNGEVCKCNAKISYNFDVPDCGQSNGDRLSKIQKANKQGAMKVNNRPTSKGVTRGAVILSATPNPFNQTLSVTVKNSKENSGSKLPYNLVLLSANGSTISTKSIDANSTVEINTATYPSGVYLLTLKGADGVTQSTQVIKVNK